ncbi:MAG: lipocalin family protein [Tunicatimonas sp.]
MKNLRVNYLIVGLLSLAFLASCVGDDDESDVSQGDIVGTWRAQSISFTVDGMSLRDYAKNLFASQNIPITDDELDALTEETESDAEDLASVLEFKSDGTLLITDTEDGTVASETWKVSGNTLTIDDGDEADVFIIERLTDNELHLLTQFDEEAGLGIPGSEDADLRLLFTLTR